MHKQRSKGKRKNVFTKSMQDINKQRWLHLSENMVRSKYINTKMGIKCNNKTLQQISSCLKLEHMAHKMTHSKEPKISHDKKSI